MNYFAVLIGTMGIVTARAAKSENNSSLSPLIAMDVPYVPVQDTPIVLAQATTTSTPADYLLKTCMQGSSGGANLISPGMELVGELQNRSREWIRDEEIATREASVKVTLLVNPTHGKLVSQPLDKGIIYYEYQSELGYVGKNKAVFLAELAGKRYRIVYNLIVSKVLDDNYPLCPPSSQLIKLQNKPVSGASDYNLGNITVTFADLAGGALGQTTGNSITLDTTAAGNGWFIDTTPADNSEYLPTSTPNEWVAKAGSADGTTSHSTKLANNASQVAGYAAGKMDMLSVLLHEYGHALGIDHNPDAHDYMGTTLTAGVRRLPTADEMALMQQLIAQAKTELTGSVGAALAANNSPSFAAKAAPTTPSNVPFPTLPLGGIGIALKEQLAIRLGEQTTPAKSLVIAGLLQRNRYGGLNAVLNNSTLTQYDVAANATLTNGNLSSGNVWATQGSVTSTPSAFVTSDPSTGSGRTVDSFATLNEIPTSQTRLSQVLMVNANVRYLSPTLSGIALGSNDLNDVNL
jgi:Matrixin